MRTREKRRPDKIQNRKNWPEQTSPSTHWIVWWMSSVCTHRHTHTLADVGVAHTVLCLYTWPCSAIATIGRRIRFAIDACSRWIYVVCVRARSDGIGIQVWLTSRCWISFEYIRWTYRNIAYYLEFGQKFGLIFPMSCFSFGCGRSMRSICATFDALMNATCNPRCVTRCRFDGIHISWAIDFFRKMKYTEATRLCECDVVIESLIKAISALLIVSHTSFRESSTSQRVGGAEPQMRPSNDHNRIKIDRRLTVDSFTLFQQSSGCRIQLLIATKIVRSAAYT